jgi:hypothetical protein
MSIKGSNFHVIRLPASDFDNPIILYSQDKEKPAYYPVTRKTEVKRTRLTGFLNQAIYYACYILSACNHVLPFAQSNLV